MKEIYREEDTGRGLYVYRAGKTKLGWRPTASGVRPDPKGRQPGRSGKNED